jgi:hypothetical protein
MERLVTALSMTLFNVLLIILFNQMAGIIDAQLMSLEKGILVANYGDTFIKGVLEDDIELEIDKSLK